MTKRKDDLIPVVATRGAQPAFPARQPERTVTEDAVLQHETPLHKLIHGGMVDSIRRLINVYRNTITEPVTNLFKRGVDNLDDVLDSSTFRRVKATATDVNGNIDLTGTGFVGKNIDNIADGTTFHRPKAGALDVNGNIDLNGAAWVNKNQDNLPDGATYLRVPQYAGGDNLVDNGNFEASGSGAFPPGWSQRGTATFAYETVAPFNGTRSAKLTTTAINDGMTTTRRYKVRAGEVWKISGAMQSGGGGTSALLVLVFRNGAGGSVGSISTSTSSATFVTQSATGTVPAGAVYAELSCEAVSVVGTVWFDDLIVMRVRSIDDEVQDGTSFGRTVISYLTTNKVIKLLRSSIDEPAANFFKRATDTLDDVQNSATYRRISANAADTSGNIDLNGSAWINKDQDHLPDGATFLRTTQMIGGDNCVENGNFEASTSLVNGFPPGWANRGSPVCSYETATQYQGAQSAKLVASVAGDGMHSIRKWKVRPGETWKASVALKSSGAGVVAEFDLCFRDSTGAGLAFLTLSTTSTSWSVQTGTAVVPANAVYMDIVVAVSGGAGTTWVDDIVALRVRSLDDEVLDGSTYSRTLGTRVNVGRPVVNFFENIHINDQIVQARDCPVSTPTVVTAGVTSGSALGAWTSGRSLSFGLMEMNILSNGGIVDFLAWDSTGGTGPNGYIFRFDGRSGQVAGQVLKVVNGSWTSGGGGAIGAAQNSANGSALTGWHHMRIMFRAGSVGRFDIWIDGVWVWSVGSLSGTTSAADTTYACNSGHFYYGYEVNANPVIAPVTFGHDQRRNQQVSAGGLNSAQTSRPLTSTNDGVSLGAIAVAAHTVQYGFGTVSYNSGSINTLPFGTSYYVYADDPTFAGGAVTYVATTALENVVAGSGRYYVGKILVGVGGTSQNQSGGGGGSQTLH
jgi:hypothetical protein